MPQLFTRAGDFLFSIPLKRLALVLWLIMLARTGVWFMGSWPDQVMVALDPFANHFQHPDQHFIFWNYLGPFIGHLLFGFLSVGDVGPFMTAFFVFNLAMAGAASWLFCKIAMARLSDHAARAAMLLYFMMPVSATAYFWVGMDGLTTLLLLLPFLNPASAALGLVSGVLLGMQHFEQGFVAYAALLFSLFLAKGQGAAVMTTRHAAFILGGVVLGKLLLVAWFAALNIELNSGRIYWFLEHASKVIGYTVMHPHLVYASIFGCAWLAVFRVAEMKDLRLAFFLPLAALLVFPFLAEDETRVLALITFPLVATWMLLYPRFLETLEKGFLGLLALLFLLVPWLWVWRGEPRISAFPFDVAVGLNALIGWPAIPEDSFRWLFWWQ